ncbi:hypothetical protein SLEP1_g23964 [Rubroshorea leprosula]|uniref:Uncharacterized protein n=1 Tax=Rubroshorea leprosula TaxID=152421 RepID=A0AAV5JEB6_9ROSI|nr:hypothetical protein SLEP1_g23964 [Rubroshorea leprosula]
MGFIRRSFTFMLGTIAGIYIAQNYSVPDIRKLATMGIFMVKKVEQTYRKPTTDDGEASK